MDDKDQKKILKSIEKRGLNPAELERMLSSLENEAPKNMVTFDPSLSRLNAVIKALKTRQSSSWKHMTDTFFVTLAISYLLLIIITNRKVDIVILV